VQDLISLLHDFKRVKQFDEICLNIFGRLPSSQSSLSVSLTKLNPFLASSLQRKLKLMTPLFYIQ